MEADRAHFTCCPSTSLEHFRSLRNISFAPRAERLLRLQRTPTDCVFHGCVRIRAVGYPDGHRNVSSRREPFPAVSAYFRREAIGEINPLLNHAQFLWVLGCARRLGGDDRIQAQHESHRHGQGRRKSYWDVAGIRRHRRGRALVGCGAPFVMAPSAWTATRFEVRDLSHATAYVEPTRSTATLL